MRTSFPDSLRLKLIPWSQENAAERFIVARAQMKQSEMPTGVRLSKRKIAGSREVVKNRRYYGNMRSCIALWPEAKLNETGYSKMLCVLAGNITFQLGRYGIDCGEGFFIVVPPGVPTTNGAQMPYHAEGSFCEILTLVLHRHAVQCVTTLSRSESPTEEYKENYLFNSSRLASLLHSVIEEQIEFSPDAGSISADVLAGFWKMLQREFREGRYVTPGPTYRPQLSLDEDTDFKSELLSFIEANVNNSPTLESVAKGMYLSRTQFVRRMRREAGKTFVQFLTDYRIEEAQALLRDSDWTISAIAGFLGFKTPSYFRTVFLRHTGLKAGEYRARTRNQKRV